MQIPFTSVNDTVNQIDAQVHFTICIPFLKSSILLFVVIPTSGCGQLGRCHLPNYDCYIDDSTRDSREQYNKRTNQKASRRARPCDRKQQLQCPRCDCATSTCVFGLLYLRVLLLLSFQAELFSLASSLPSSLSSSSATNILTSMRTLSSALSNTVPSSQSIKFYFDAAVSCLDHVL